MIIKICRNCKNPFKSAVSPYIQFCSIECIDQAYRDKNIDMAILDYAAKIMSIFIKRERERDDTEALRELFYIEILKLNRLISKKDYNEYKKELLGNDSEK